MLYSANSLPFNSVLIYRWNPSKIRWEKNLTKWRKCRDQKQKPSEWCSRKQQLFSYVIYIAYDNVYQYWMENKIFLFFYFFNLLLYWQQAFPTLVMSFWRLKVCSSGSSFRRKTRKKWDILASINKELANGLGFKNLEKSICFSALTIFVKISDFKTVRSVPSIF